MTKNNMAVGVKPKKISKREAEYLFYNTNNVIYLKTDRGLLDTWHNSFMLSRNAIDAQMNIAMMGRTPLQYGFNMIVYWLKERMDKPNSLSFYTLYSDEFWYLQNGKTL
jgi:hypothetical protein